MSERRGCSGVQSTGAPIEYLTKYVGIGARLQIPTG